MSTINNSVKNQRTLKESKWLYQNGRILEAKLLLQELLKSLPFHPELLAYLGAIELQERNFDKGIKYLEKSLEVNPKQPKTISHLANGYLEIGNITKSIELYSLAIKLSPSSFEFFYNRARAKRILKNYESAIEDYKAAINLNNQYFMAMFNLGFLYNEIKKFDLALKYYNKALILNTFYPQIYYNRGIVYENMGKTHEALSDFNKAIDLNPNFTEAYISRGNNKFLQHNFDSALEDYTISIALDPNSHEAIFNSSIIHLLKNNYKEGWKLYETRWQAKKMKWPLAEKPLLTNFNHIDKKILIWAEQGLGDQIMYGSLLIDALKTSNYFYVTLDARLLDLFIRSFSWSKNIKFISSDIALDEVESDFHLPLANLGSFFREEIKDFRKHPINYILSDKEFTLGLRQKLFNQKKICGISWMSKNPEIGCEKSLSLVQLLPILSLKNFTFVDLQYGDNSVEKENIFQQHGINIQTISEIDNFNNIDGLTSLIDACDFVVTTSNVTAHIAGALNKKTYLLLSYNCGKLWYWGENDAHSLWYPSIEIYRNTNSNSWEKPIAELSERLRVSYA
jgi:tetratricopeptide (TPR) repeat protein